jgi:hypothetical protein
MLLEAGVVGLYIVQGMGATVCQFQQVASVEIEHYCSAQPAGGVGSGDRCEPWALALLDLAAMDGGHVGNAGAFSDLPSELRLNLRLPLAFKISAASSFS